MSVKYISNIPPYITNMLNMYANKHSHKKGNILLALLTNWHIFLLYKWIISLLERQIKSLLLTPQKPINAKKKINIFLITTKPVKIET